MPDTVLKWIKKGQLAATRTAGGHYRIDKEHLLPFLPETGQTDAEQAVSACPSRPGGVRPLRCWEYMSETLRDECKDCVAYLVHASWCFELMKVVHGSGISKHLCPGPCQDCPYYRLVHGLPTNVLIVSRDETLIQAIARHSNGCLACRFARHGYDASAIISVFRPALVIVGERVAAGETGLVKALANDPRAYGVRVLLGVRNGPKPPIPPDSGIAGSIDIPFTCEQLAAWTGHLPVEPLPAEEPPSDPVPPPAQKGGRRPKSPGVTGTSKSA